MLELVERFQPGARARVLGARLATRVGILVRGWPQWPLAYRDFCTLRIVRVNHAGYELLGVSPALRAANILT